jgi:ADP-ribose pyrophosphatase YjhB (NUDIX family)
MNFCSNCAAPLIFELPEGDHLPRHVCRNCGMIHYQNPRVIVGCLPVFEQKIMLCRRGIEPQFGKWNLPGGFMENGETVQQGAAREMYEETGATGEVLHLHSLYNVVPVNQVHLHFYTQLTTPHYQLTPESTEIVFFTESEIPWDDIAFASTAFGLKCFWVDVRQGTPQTHIGQYQSGKL